MSDPDITYRGVPITALGNDLLRQALREVADAFQTKEITKIAPSLSGTNPAASAAFWEKVRA